MSVSVHAVKLTHARPAWVAVQGWADRARRPSGVRARGVETIASDPSAAPLGRRGPRFPARARPRAGDAADAIGELTDGRGVEASVDAAGVPAALAAALESTAVHGRIVVVAVPLQPSPADPGLSQARGDLTMSGGQLAEDFHDTIAGMERGDYPHELGRDDPLRRPPHRGLRALHRQEG